MIYLIAPGHAATAQNYEIAQLLVSTGYTIVSREAYLEHIDQLTEPLAPTGDEPARFEDIKPKEA